MIQLEDFLNQNLTKETVKNYLYEIKKYRTLNPKSEAYNYQNTMEYVQQLRGLYPANTVRRVVFAIKKYYDYLIEIEIITDNPARGIKLRDGKEPPIQLQDLFTENELQKLLEPRAERYKKQTKTNQIIISLLVNQALKVGEIIQLKTTDLNLEKATINISKTGQTNSRILPLKAEQILLFFQYLEEIKENIQIDNRQDNSLLYNKLNSKITKDDINYLISTYQKQFTKNLNSVTIRQSVIANLFIKNNDIRTVQIFAGHKHPDTTEKYRQTGLNALKTAIDKLHPIR